MNSSTQKHTVTPEILLKTLVLAETWQNRANSLRTREELAHQRMMHRMLKHPSDKTVLMHLIDQSFRSENPLRAVDQFEYLLKHFGIPAFFPSFERWLLKTFLLFGKIIPKFAHSQIFRKIRQQTRLTILDEKPEILLQQRKCKCRQSGI